VNPPPDRRLPAPSAQDGLPRVWRHAGFTLPEVLIAAALVLAVSGSALLLMDRMRAAFDGQSARFDLEQRLRAAVSALERDLQMAGAGVTAGVEPGSLLAYLPPVAPYRRGQVGDDGAAGVHHREGTVSVMYVPSRSAQARVRGVIDAGLTLIVEAWPNCGDAWHERLCGFVEGMRTAIIDPSGVYDLATVSEVNGTRVVLRLGDAAASRYDGGRAVLAEVSADTYYLDPAGGDGVPRLMQYDGFRTDRPIVDHVVSLALEYFGDPDAPQRLEADPLHRGRGPRATYGPSPPEVGVDDPSDTWGPGENCLFSRVEEAWVPRLTRLNQDNALLPLAPAQFEDGPWCADASARGRYDADLLRVRRIRIHLRVQAAAATLRGPAGQLFAHAGTSSQAERFVPDVRLTFDVAPRNLNGGR
jgi:prepilin-type N-terminal cleavage/methylation domain-containing protein